MDTKNHQHETPWSIAFKLALCGIGCLVLGYYIQGQFSDPVSKTIASIMINMGAMIMLILLGAAAIVLLIWHLYNKYCRRCCN